jgi:hypothetical protein
MNVYLISVGCVAIGFAIGCPFGVGAALWGMMDWENKRRGQVSAIAMQTLLANRGDADANTIAVWSVTHADALIEQLKKEDVQA